MRTVTVSDPLTHVTTYKFDIASQRLTDVTDANSHTTSAQYDSNGRLTRITKPEGNYTQLTYDARGNVTESRTVAKAGSGLADIVTTAGLRRDLHQLQDLQPAQLDHGRRATRPITLMTPPTAAC